MPMLRKVLLGTGPFVWEKARQPRKLDWQGACHMHGVSTHEGVSCPQTPLLLPRIHFFVLKASHPRGQSPVGGYCYPAAMLSVPATACMIGASA